MAKYTEFDEMLKKLEASDSPEDRLYVAVHKISERLGKAEGMNILFARHCHPSMTKCFESLRSYYKKGRNICLNYYSTKNLLKLVNNLLDCCFIEEVLMLKEFVSSNDEVFRTILEVEKDYEYVIANYNNFKVH